MKLPPVPKWNTKTDDFDSADFLSRAQDCERSLIPTDFVFPRAGQIWEAVCACAVHVRVWIIRRHKGPVVWKSARLGQGERVRVLTLDDPKPLEIIFTPVHYQELHESIAPESQRYVLWLRTTRVLRGVGYEMGYFNELFRLVEDAV